jgi:hypothetical protein
MEQGPPAFRFLERDHGCELEIPTGFRWQPQLFYRNATAFVTVALDDREQSFDIRLGPLDGGERPDAAAGASLRDLLEAAGEEAPPFSFEPDRLAADLEPWADALRRHAAGPLSG